MVIIAVYFIAGAALLTAFLEIYFYTIFKSKKAMQRRYRRYKEAYEEFDVDIFVDQIYSIKNKIWSIPYAIYKLPYTKERYDPKKRLTINSHGFRAPEPSDKKEGIIRLCILGGSVAFGAYAVRNEFAFPALLEKELNSRSKRPFEVINCAVGGYVAAQELALLQFFVQDIYKPDMVLMLDGFNDFINALTNRDVGYPLVWKEYSKTMDSFIHRRYLSVLSDMLVNHIMRESNIISYLDPKIRKFVHSGKMRKSDRDLGDLFAREARHYHGVHLMANAVMASRGIRFISALQPTIGYGVKRLTAFEKIVVAKYNLSVYGKGFYDRLKLFYDTVRKLFYEKTDAMHWIDLTGIFDETEESIFIDNVHMGDRGAKIMAGKTADDILKVVTGDRR